MVDTVTRAPVPGALVTPSWDLPAVTAGPDGTYELGAVPFPPTGPYDLTISADGFVTRTVWLNWQPGARSGVTLDVIRDAPPFSMQFYNEMVRGTFDQEEAPWPIRRLPSAPAFYVQTVDQNGRAIEPEVLAVVRDAIQRAVPAYSGGRLSAAIESGAETRPPQDGWVVVTFVRNPEDDETCGLAYIGRLAGEITLHNDICSCGSVKVPGSLVMHEVGHALGFFHVDDIDSVMYPIIPRRCPPGEPSDAELYHAAIAYSRPRSNTQPDDDPSEGAFSTATDAIRGVRVRN